MGGKRNAYSIFVGQKERYHEEEQDVDESILLKWILERSDGEDCIDLAQDKDQWRSLK
jgi:hypothetical protein